MIRRVFSKWLWLFSLIISLANIVVVCLYLPAGYDPDFDYLGLIVGSFSILVTVLIGWNIYTLVDFKNEVKVIKNYKEELDEVKNIQKSNSNAITQLRSLTEAIETKLNGLCDADLFDAQIYFESLRLSLIKIEVYCRMGQHEFAADEAKIIIDDFNEEERRGLTNYQWQTIMSIFKEKQISKVLPNYYELKKCLNSINVIDRNQYGTKSKSNKHKDI